MCLAYFESSKILYSMTDDELYPTADNADAATANVIAKNSCLDDEIGRVMSIHFFFTKKKHIVTLSVTDRRYLWFTIWVLPQFNPKNKNKSYSDRTIEIGIEMEW